MRVMNTVFTIFLLGLLGFLVGILLSGALKRSRTGNSPRIKRGSADQRNSAATLLDEETKKQMTQLKQQLDSGLITKEEYQAGREKLLRG